MTEVRPGFTLLPLAGPPGSANPVQSPFEAGRAEPGQVDVRSAKVRYSAASTREATLLVPRRCRSRWWRALVCGRFSPRQARAVKAILGTWGGTMAAVASSLQDLPAHCHSSVAPEVQGSPFSSSTLLNAYCVSSSSSVPSGLYGLYMLLKPTNLRRLKQLAGSGL